MDRILELLKMVESGEISSMEAYDEIRQMGPSFKAKSNYFLRIRIFGDDLTKIDIPLGLADLGLKFANEFVPDFKKLNISQKDLDQLKNSIKEGQSGEVFWAQAETGEKIHIFIE